LIRLQLRAVVEGLSGYSASAPGAYVLAVTAVVVGVRLVWFFSVPYPVFAVDRRPAQQARRAGARGRFLVAWSGMRGAVSLAVALALPLTTAAGGPFGRTVNLAAWIAAHAGPGQVLVSESVAEAGLPAGVVLAEAGEVRLKGFARPVRLLETSCTADGLTDLDRTSQR
jgi:NhaP-type Na+/H+ or K+/H+ antiporter